jgi:hypothetical protein
MLPPRLVTAPDCRTALPLTLAAIVLCLAACRPAAEPAGTGTATLSWQAPTRNVDGSRIQGLAGYAIYFGTDPNVLTHAVRVADPGLTQYAIHDLLPGKYYFSVAAFTATGQYSGLAPIVSKVIEAPGANQTGAGRSQSGSSSGNP